MGRTEQEFADLAAAAGLDLRHSTVEGLTGRGPLATGLAAVPTPVLEALAEIHRELGGDRDRLRSKGERLLTPDFMLPTGHIVEVDEIQHFTTDRLQTLERYPTGVRLGFDLGAYRRLCERHRQVADRYRAQKTAADFPSPGGRRAQRAFLDAVRDLLAPFLTGHPVVRVAAPECNARLAFERSKRQLFEVAS